MSGPKEADVQLQVNKAIEVIERQVRESGATRDLYSNLGVSEAIASQKAAHFAVEIPSWSPEAKMHAGGEMQSAQNVTEEVVSAIRDGDKHLLAAESLKHLADQSHQESQNKLNQANQLIQDAIGGLSGVVGNWVGYDAEFKLAKKARNLAKEALADEREANRLLRSASDKYREARNAFDRAASGGARAASEFRRVEELARQRVETARIAEENKRKATDANKEGESLCARIGALKHDKFAPGEFSTAKRSFDCMALEFQKNNYDGVNRLSGNCMATLRALAEKVSKAQSEWEAAKKAAENDLDTVGKELAALDKAFLAKWSGLGEGVNSIFDKFDQARRRLAAEDFQGAQGFLAEGVAAARTEFEKATTNRRKFDQREMISEAIMNALHEQGYDAPSFYFNEKDGKGNDNELSNLTIFAKSPGKLGDMRMQINLDGHVDLALEEVPEGQESECVNILDGLRDRLTGEVDFQMTNWGRAEGNSGKAREVERQQVQQIEKQRERQGG